MPLAPHLLVLGTAQDGGFPHASCDCPRCTAAADGSIPARMVASLAIVLPTARKRYLIDATPDIRPQLELLATRTWRSAGHQPGVERRPLDGVFLTHAHIGHYLGLAFFGFEAVHTQALPVYATPKMSGFLAEHAPWAQLVRMGNIEQKPTTPGDRVDLGPVQIHAHVVPHRDEYADTVAYVIQGPHRRAVYVPDTQPWKRWTAPVQALTQGAQLLIVDGSFADPAELPGRALEEIGHPMLSATMDLFQADVDNGRLEVLFTHLNHSNAAVDPRSESAANVRARGFRILADGDSIEL